jgi:transcriptional regulator with PAS, ATPase and Fis domain
LGGAFLKRFFRNKEVSADKKQISLNKKLLETILGRIGDAVCIFDRNFNILFQSPLHIKWFDKLEEFICFKRVDEIKPNRTIQTIANETGSPLHLEVSTFPIKNDEGACVAGINIVRNVSHTMELEEKSKELALFKQQQLDQLELKTIIGNSKPIQKVLEGVNKISKLDTVVYIQGDTGTGKELVARAIHKLSLRSKKPFLAINCGALSETLLDSELFGHTKGGKLTFI